jgi:hypothetical protein
LCALFVLVLWAGVSPAEELKGKIKKVDAEKNTITVTDKDGKDHTFTITDKTDVLDTKGKAITGGLKASAFKKEGQPIVITCEKKDGKEVCTKIKLED